MSDLDSVCKIGQAKMLAPDETSQSKYHGARSLRNMFLDIANALNRMVVNKFLLRPPESSEKLKQANSAPDIFVDTSTRIPTFEEIQGETRLVLPEDQENICDKISLSLGDSPFNWYPLNDMQQNHRKVYSTRSRKRVKPAEFENYKSGTFSQITKRSFNPIHLHCRWKNSKNRKEKIRQDIISTMMDDYWQFSECSDTESESQASIGSQSLENVNQNVQMPTFSSDSFVSLSEESFPKICDTEIKYPMSKNSPRQSNLSECESEDSFVIFTEDDRMLTPSVSPARKALCSAVTKLFNPIAKNRPRNQLISECSDESIIFCDDSDQDDDDECCADTELESFNGDNEDTSQQPDSGFEEKKVRFNLRTEVHVMRTWNFAYRQARKGEWEIAARDRERFKKRIEEMELVLKPALAKDLRSKIYKERFCS